MDCWKNSSIIVTVIFTCCFTVFSKVPKKSKQFPRVPWQILFIHPWSNPSGATRWVSIRICPSYQWNSFLNGFIIYQDTFFFEKKNPSIFSKLPLQVLHVKCLEKNWKSTKIPGDITRWILQKKSLSCWSKAPLGKLETFTHWHSGISVNITSRRPTAEVCSGISREWFL